MNHLITVSVIGTALWLGTQAAAKTYACEGDWDYSIELGGRGAARSLVVLHEREGEVLRREGTEIHVAKLEEGFEFSAAGSGELQAEKLAVVVETESLKGELSLFARGCEHRIPLTCTVKN